MTESFITRAAWRAVECETHKVILVRMDSGWVCPKGLTCSRLIGDTALMERVAPHLNLSSDMDSRALELTAAFAEIKRASKATHQR